MNKYPSKITRVIAACAALGAFATRGLGQETEDDKNEEKASGEVIQLSPFTVQSEKDVGYFAAETTAGTRVRQALVDIPGSAAVITRELIDDLKASEVTKAVNFGVSGVTSLDNLQEDFSIRGFREIGNFRDGVASTAFFPTQTYDLDRIEVLKGPVALSFGNGTILGGAVNMVSRKPTSELKRDVDVTIGENNLMRAAVNMSGPLTEKKDIRYRVTLGAQNDDRWKEVEYDNNTFIGGAVDMDFGRSTVSFYTYRYETDSYRYFNDFLDISGYTNGVPDGYLKLNQYSTPEFSASRSKDNFYDNLEYYFTAQLVTQLKDNLSFRAFYRYRDLQDRRGIIRGIGVNADNYTLTRQYIPFAIDNRLHTIQTDVFYTLDLPWMKHDISFGADFNRGNNRQALVVITPASIDTRNPDYSSDDTLPYGSAIPAWSSNANNEDESLSYYVQDTVSFLDGKLMFNAGIRWIDPYRVSTNRVNNTVTRTDDPVVSAPRYGIMYKFLPNFSVYATKAETVPSSQGNNQRGEPLPDTQGEIEEAGIKFFDIKTLGGSIFGSAAYFDMAKTNVRVILSDIDPQTGFNIITTTLGDTSVGYEFDLGYRVPVGPGTFDAIFTYYDADAKSSSGGRAVFAPDTVTSLLLKYAFNSGGLKGLSFGLGGYWEGDKQAAGNAAFMLPPKDDYELFINYRLEKWRFGLNVSNLTDERRVDRFATVGLVQSTDPRLVKLSVGYSW